MTPAPIDFEYLFEHSPNAYILLERDFTLVAANQAFLRVTGRRREELIGRKLFDAFPAAPGRSSREAIRRVQESLERTFAAGQRDMLALVEYPLARQTAAGPVFEERYWSATHVPVLGPDRQVRYVLQHIVDVTALQSLRQVLKDADAVRDVLLPLEVDVFNRAQLVQDVNRSLHAERQHLLQLFQQAPGFICFLRGPEHVFELASDAVYELVGHRELLGLTVEEAFPEAKGQGFIALLDKVYRSGKPYVGRDARALVRRQPDGPLTEIFVNFVLQPIFDRSGKVAGIFVQGYDVTEQHLVQSELDRYRAQLEDLVLERTRALDESQAALRHVQKLEAVGRLTGGVAHDFNNLLQVIGANLQLLQRTFQGDAAAQRRLAAALDSVERGARLASQLLAFARRQPLSPSVVNLPELLQGMDELLWRALGENVDLHIRIEPGLWNTFVDAGQLENVLLNLAINARDAMEDKGGGEFVIQARNCRLASPGEAQELELEPGEYVHLTVSDTGCGIPAELQEQVFEPFFTTKPEGQGTGLGLSMVYGFVKQSGGQIKLTSSPGEGTSIAVWLPRATRQEEQESIQMSGAARGGNETILVVEDDEAVRCTTVDMLRELGYQVLEAPDGGSALRLLQQRARVDLLFTDVIMPGPVTGVELVRRARRLQPDLPVLFTSGYANDTLVRDGRLEPGVNLLCKPFRQEDLDRRVRHVLNNARQAALAKRALTGSQGGEAGRTAAGAGSRLRILLVEDEELIREALRELLAETGYRVRAVASAEEAEALLATERFDVLFTDISLPGESGAELACRARRRDPRLAIIIASGYSRDALVLENDALADGVFLSKPFDVAAVEQAMAEIEAARHHAATGNVSRR